MTARIDWRSDSRYKNLVSRDGSQTVSADQVCKDSRIATQGVQPLVRNEVTQNSPDIQMPGLFGLAERTYGEYPYRSAPLLPRDIRYLF